MRVALLCLVLVTVGQGLAGSCPTNAYIEARNAFAVLPTDKIGLLKAPTTAGIKSCGSEWKTHGTCCNVNSLTANVKLDEENTTRTWRRLVRLYGYFLEASQEIYQKLAELAVIPMPKNKKDKEVVKAAQNLLADINIVNSLHLKGADSFEADTEKCWKYVQTLRTASVCSMCSGNASSFFKQNKGVSITQYCDSALKECYQSLKVSGRLMKLILWTIGEDSDLEKTGISVRQGHKLLYIEKKVIKEARQKLPKFYNEFIKDKLPELLQKLSNDHKANDKALNVAICNKFLNLAHKPFISYFTDTLYGDGNAFCKAMGSFLGYHKIFVHVDLNSKLLLLKHKKDIKKNVGKFKAQLENRLKNWKLSKESSRVLQLDNPDFGFMGSDLTYLDMGLSIASNTRDMVTSNCHQNKRPMNLSMAFP